ncbi:MAG: glycosyltransferase family 4 protein [Azonexus sp.]|nr:glycosyltransferase family 4 protein [Azonexus sp.]
MRVAALTSGHNTPSARFRIRQHLPNLRSAGVDVREYCPALDQAARLPGQLGKVRARYIPPLVIGQMSLNLALRVPGIIGSHRTDVTWLERNFVPGLDDMVRLLRKPLIVDIDDAIWLYNPLGKSQIARLVGYADMVFAGNAFLADWCSQYCSNIRVIPTAVDADRFAPRLTPKDPDSPFVIGWIGTSGNFRFLKAIEGSLVRFLSDHPSARLMIVADRAPTELSVPLEQLLFRPWNPTTEHLLLHEFDVGIMPIDDSDLSRGKCSFKMLQYMAAGIPVIASPFGMNKEVLSLGSFGIAAGSSDEWQDAFATFSRSPAKREAAGRIARDVLINRFSLNKVSENILDSISFFC